ncbi:hypothetical protein AK830_g174 [Neonectria ditissima]|uniref:Enoyl-CoA hydratase n=1 Tax=Neonectria ditissima TaxID=78410 RepID=A0A0P7BZ91_9HYPO|nr:hypothetical protein AK830_g174 [Neonectria ditissima]
MDSQAVPKSYDGLSFEQLRVDTYPNNAPGATPVMILTINRPEKHNAFTVEIEDAMIKALQLFDLDDRVKAVVVTGAGRTFCAGADLDIGLERVPGEGSKDHRDGGGRLALAVHACRKPVIAAIQGSAVGIGMTMTLPMSIRVVSKTAKVGFVFARRGVVMEACSSFFLPRLIGYSRALYLTTTGSVVQADAPVIRDLFAEILDSPSEVLPRALEIATDIAQNTSTISTYLMREMMWRNPGSAESTHLLDSEIMFQLYDKKDKHEGIASFLEKRQAAFTGSVHLDMPQCLPWWTPVNLDKPRKVLQSSKL